MEKAFLKKSLGKKQPSAKKKIAKKKAVKKKPAKGKKGTAVIMTKTVHAPRSTINAARISTEELKQMQAFGVLPFELRSELYKRLGKK